MQVVIGVFETQPQAESALARLRESGYSEGQVALVSNARGDEQPAAAAAAPAEQPAAATALDSPTAQDRPAATQAAGETAAPGTGAPAETGDTAASPTVEAATTGEAADQAVENAALGGAIGVMAGGAVLGPVGLAIGGLAGAGIAAWLARRNATAAARADEARLERGRYLVAVEVDGPAAEVHTILNEAGATRIDVEPM